MPGLVFLFPIITINFLRFTTLNFELVVVGCRSLLSLIVVVVEIIIHPPSRVVDDQSRYGIYGSILGGIPY